MEVVEDRKRAESGTRLRYAPSFGHGLGRKDIEICRSRSRGSHFSTGDGRRRELNVSW